MVQGEHCPLSFTPLGTETACENLGCQRVNGEIGVCRSIVPHGTPAGGAARFSGLGTPEGAGALAGLYIPHARTRPGPRMRNGAQANQAVTK